MMQNHAQSLRVKEQLNLFPQPRIYPHTPQSQGLRKYPPTKSLVCFLRRWDRGGVGVDPRSLTECEGRKE
eukprot:5731763-Amphidinium_carterae.1